jgi:uncharacterized protein (TIGR02453 family)
MTTTTARFAGFTPEAIHFLLELSVNNDRTWFQARKGEYEKLLKEPLEALCNALAQQFEDRGIPLRADPVKSPFRIYRDVRFSKDKSPYKTHISASFPWASGPGDDSSHGMGGYFHFQPDVYFAGGGMWLPERPLLEAWRALVGGAPATVHAAIEDSRFVASFGAIEGERLVRVPTGWPADHPDAELLRLKDVTFGRQLTEDEALSPQLPKILGDAFEAAEPVLRLLASLPA